MCGDAAKSTVKVGPMRVELCHAHAAGASIAKMIVLKMFGG